MLGFFDCGCFGGVKRFEMRNGGREGNFVVVGFWGFLSSAEEREEEG